ncbi:methyl-accepting chemotaxis protein [Maliponia aquimaris]|uniref:Methyl-accepting chemotaxis protein I n=1 Tax=Maliponia aquimaris TaxID=1673631 RepID=A0A238KR29_9RHOB|nr:methyl-accepting chemotaxis protein [Maliponia aquimaris]SMX45110.1 Methyl-accepting chemotaxis protein I [Maliponia aquimaris]
MARKDGNPGRRSGLHSVFVRCAAIMAVTTVVVAGLLSVQASRVIDSLAVSGVVELATKSAVLSADAMVKPIRFKALPKVEEELAGAMAAAGDNGRAMVVLDGDGVLLASLGDDPELIEEIGTLARDAVQAQARQVARQGLLVAEPVLASVDGPVIGAVAMGFSAETALAGVAADKRRMVLTAALVFAVMVGLTLWLLQRSLGRPLAQVTSAIRVISQGDYDSDHGMQGRLDEFGTIGRHMDLLTDALRQARAAEAARAEAMQQQAEMVRHLGAALDTLADGVLNREIQAEFPPEYKALRDNYNRAVSHLRRVIDEVADSAGSLLDNANQIAAASDDLSRRTETQAATLEQSAAALEELLGSVSAAAENAQRADAQVRDTRDIARRNGEVMKSAIEAMGAIEKSSEQISEITSVIDDIAFQTNLLALNAGVEAARAGESGKGFAVVATEVRGLAQRSAAAAQQIKDLIIGAGEQVQSGVKLVEEAGGALQEVLAKVADVSDAVSGIANSAGEQAQGLQEINVGISNLDRVTQQNAAMVEEATASAHLMRNHAGTLSQTVGRFVTTPAAESAKAGDGKPQKKARAA